MSIEISDASLIWEADITTDKIKAKVAEVNKIMAGVSKTLTFDETIGNAATSAGKKLKPLKDSLQETSTYIKKNTQEVRDNTKALLDEDAAMIKNAKSRREQNKAIYETNAAIDSSVTTGNRSSASVAGKTFDSSTLLGQESVKIKASLSTLRASIQEATGAFEPLNAVTLLYVETLTGLEIQQQNVRTLQNQLNAAYKAEQITLSEFVTSTEQLSAAQLQISESMAVANAEHKKFQANMAAETSEGIVLKQALQSLEIQYQKLAVAEGEAAAKAKFGDTIGPLKTQIAQLSPVVAEVEGKVKSGVAAVGNFATKALGYVRQLAYILPGIGVAGILGFFSEKIVDFFRLISGTATETLSKTKLLGEATKKVADNYVNQLTQLRVFQEQLSSSNLTEQQRIEIYNKLIALNPELVKGLDSQKLSYDSLSGAVALYTAELRKNFQLEANKEAITNSLKQELDLRQKISELDAEKLKKQREYSEALKKDPTGVAGTSQLQSVQNALNNIDVKNQEVQKALFKQTEITESLIGDNIRLQQTKAEGHKRNLADIEADIAAQKKLQETATDRKEFDAIKERIKELEKEKEAITGKDEKKQKGESAYQALLNKRLSMLEKIAELERDAAQTGLTKKASEIDNINQKYDKQIQQVKDLNDQIARYNASHKGKDVQLFGQNEIDRLNAARNLELLNFKYKDDLNNYIESLDAKADSFEKFREVLETGTEEQVRLAKKQYGEDAANYRTYLDFLKAERNRLLPALFGTGGDTGDLLKLNALNEKIKLLQPKQDDKDKQENQKNLDTLLQQVNTFYIRKQQIENKYAKLSKTLRENTEGLSPDELKRRQEILENQKNAEYDSIADLYLKQDGVIANYYNHKEELSAKATQAVIDRLKKERDAVDKTSKEYEILTNAIAAAQGDKDSKSGQELVARLRSTASIIGEIFSNVTLDINENLKITGQQIESLVNSVATLFDKNASKGAQVGSIIGIITFAITTVRDGLISAQDLLTGLEGSKAGLDDVTLSLAAQNRELERQQDLIDGLYGKDRLQATQDFYEKVRLAQNRTFNDLKKLQIDVIKSQKNVFVDPIFGTSVENSGLAGIWTQIATGGTAKTKIQVDLETVDTSGFTTIDQFVELLDKIDRNGGKLDGKIVVEDDLKALRDLVDSFNDLQDKERQLKAQLAELFTGTTADQIGDAIIEGLQQGKRASKDFADNFEDLMRGAILNSIKIQTLEKPLQAFYEQFATLAASNGALTPAEIQQLQDAYNNIINNASEQFRQLEQITKIDLSKQSNDQNSLAGAIKGITAEQADLLAGQFGGLRLTAIDQLKTLNQVFASMQLVERNTASMDANIVSLLDKFGSYESKSKAIAVRIVA